MRSIASFMVLVLIMTVASFGSAIAQSESPATEETTFGSIELNESWTTIESNMAIIIVDDRGQISIYPGDGNMRAMLIDGKIVDEMYPDPSPPAEVGQSAEGLALVVENPVDGSGFTRYGYQTVFDFIIVELPEDISVTIYNP